ncbi:hypothetical protein DFH07DRAFT_1018554 [Mycena maculata]|uniref:Uncharacterized protein n=1 Tax=Mycena maculata TaxID=230809 RepID=A0AAD7JGS5_9AGAR|nr:hypothetical protein DFH07DRAFT_1018554 [Mycena maculata]
MSTKVTVSKVTWADVMTFLRVHIISNDLGDPSVPADEVGTPPVRCRHPPERNSVGSVASLRFRFAGEKIVELEEFVDSKYSSAYFSALRADHAPPKMAGNKPIDSPDSALFPELQGDRSVHTHNGKVFQNPDDPRFPEKYTPVYAVKTYSRPT